jgi:hypothetical protein
MDPHNATLLCIFRKKTQNICVLKKKPHEMYFLSYMAYALGFPIGQELKKFKISAVRN